MPHVLLAQQTVTTAPTAVATQPGAARPKGPQQEAPFWAGPWVPLILVLVIFYFFIFRSKRGEQKKRDEMLRALKRGDRVQTIGGILGNVLEVRDHEVVLKVDETNNTKLHVIRSAIARVVTEEAGERKP